MMEFWRSQNPPWHDRAVRAAADMRALPESNVIIGATAVFKA